MILTIYAILLFLSLILVGLGYYIDNPVLEISGFTFLFLLGFVMNGGTLKIPSGENQIENYAYDNGSLDKVIINTTTTYEYFNDDAGTYVIGISLNHFFGWLTSIIGVLGMTITIASMRNKRGMNDG